MQILFLLKLKDFVMIWLIVYIWEKAGLVLSALKSTKCFLCFYFIIMLLFSSESAFLLFFLVKVHFFLCSLDIVTIVGDKLSFHEETVFIYVLILFSFSPS